MRTTAIGGAVVLLMAGCASTRPAPKAPAEASRAQVQQALDRWNDTALRGDLPAFLAQFDEGAEVLLVGSDAGEVFQGRAAIEGWLGKLFKRNRFGWQMDRVIVDADGDAAWVFVDGAMIVRDLAGKQRFSTPYRFSGVLVRRGDGWAWRLFHGSIPRAE